IGLESQEESLRSCAAEQGTGALLLGMAETGAVQRAVVALQCPWAVVALQCPWAVVALQCPWGVVAPQCPRAVVALQCPRAVVAPQCPRGVVALQCPRGVMAPQCPQGVLALQCPQGVLALQCPQGVVALQCPGVCSGTGRDGSTGYPSLGHHSSSQSSLLVFAQCFQGLTFPLYPHTNIFLPAFSVSVPLELALGVGSEGGWRGWQGWFGALRLHPWEGMS
uniref:Uncharacterized protein n=1 Tax=Catharus ustulatus TaxID=91951 RepID=A0A8C3UAB8_CATUS